MANGYIEQQLLQKRRGVYFKNGKWVVHVIAIVIMCASSVSIHIKGSVKVYGTMQAVLTGFFINLPFLLSFYFYCLYLVPICFKAKRYRAFWVLLAGLLSVMPLVDFGYTRLIASLSPIQQPEEPSHNVWHLHDYYINFIFEFMTFSSILYLMELVEGIRTLQEIMTNEHQLAMTGLQSIKMQMNPEFMARSLDGIILLSQLQDPKAPGAVINFSDVLRYRLYRGNQTLVPLTEELQQLSNLFTFQNNLTQQAELAILDVEGNTDGRYVPPLSLINIAEPLLGTFETGHGWSLLFYLLVEERDLQLAIELQSGNGSLVESKIKKLRTDMNLLWQAELTFNLVKAETNYSLRICLPNLANSTAL